MVALHQRRRARCVGRCWGRCRAEAEACGRVQLQTFISAITVADHARVFADAHLRSLARGCNDRSLQQFRGPPAFASHHSCPRHAPARVVQTCTSRSPQTPLHGEHTTLQREYSCVQTCVSEGRPTAHTDAAVPLAAAESLHTHTISTRRAREVAPRLAVSTTPQELWQYRDAMARPRLVACYTAIRRAADSREPCRPRDAPLRRRPWILARRRTPAGTRAVVAPPRRDQRDTQQRPLLWRTGHQRGRLLCVECGSRSGCKCPQTLLTRSTFSLIMNVDEQQGPAHDRSMLMWMYNNFTSSIRNYREGRV